VHLLPSDGIVKGRDGREWELVDPGAVVLAFQSNGADLPIDYEHQNDNPAAKLKGPVPAAGWIKELRADTGGIWGRVEWTATAAEMIGRKEYRYISPVLVYHEKSRQILRLKGAGLVHSPNLYLTALASQDAEMIPPKPADQIAAKPDQGEPMDLAALVAALAKMLGLPPETPPQSLFAKLKEKIGAEPDPAKFVPVATVQAMLSERNLSIATASEERVGHKVAEAVRLGHIPPAMKDWATALCRSNEASFDTFIASTGPAFSTLLRSSHATGLPPQSPQHRAGSDLANAICSQLGLKPGTLIE
jgi:phage I-like protein